MKKIECEVLPDKPDSECVYTLLPVEAQEGYYDDRTDRNIGWINREEQELLKTKTVGIAGCGGMGGLLGQALVRAGIGKIKIADNEIFDASNINRQFGAKKITIGQSKAFVTASEIRKITDDTTLIVYPKGINENSVDEFIDGCDILCDEIEFWAVGSRILFHQKARQKGVNILNANTIGFGMRLFLFTKDSETVESCFGISYEEAKQLQEKISQKTATKQEIQRVMNMVMDVFVPDLPSYANDDTDCSNERVIRKRLFDELKAPIFATNPVMATGFLANYVVLSLLQSSSKIKRNITTPPEMPGFLYFDSAFMKSKIYKGKWWNS